MVDVVGLRYVTEGEQKALRTLDAWKAGLIQTRDIQERYAGVMNRSMQEQIRAVNNVMRMRARAARETEMAAQREARAVEAAAQREIAAAARRDVEDRRAFQAYLRAQRERESAARRVAREAEAAAQREAAATAELARETQALARAYNPVMAAATAYERRVEELNRAHQLGVLTLDQLQAELAQTAAAYNAIGTDVNRATAFVNNFSAANTFAGRRMNGTGMAMQQVGYQVGDFLVQVQSGTNAFVAFGQQATQLAGILPLMGAGFMGLSTGALVALSAGLGIAIPLVTAIGAALVRTRQAAKDAAPTVETLADRLRTLDGALRDYLRTREAARLGITEDVLLGREALSEAVERHRAEIEAIREFFEAQFVGMEVSDSFLRPLLAQSEEYRAALEKLVEAETRLAALREKEGAAQYAAFAERLTQYQDELRLQNTIAQHGEDSAQVRQLRLEQAIAAEMRRIEAMRVANEITDAQAVALKDVAEQALRAEDATRGMEGSLGAAANQAERLRSALDAAASAGASRQRQIAVLRAQIEAARGGASTEVAGTRAETAFDMTQAGVDPTLARAAGAIAASEAAQVEALRKELDALTRTGGAGAGLTQEQTTLESIVATMSQRIERERELAGLTGRARREREIALELQDQLAQAGQRYTEQEIANAAQRIAAQEAARNVLQQQAADFQRIGETMESTMKDAFMSMAEDAKNVGAAFRDVTRQIISDLYEVYVIQRLVGSVGGGGIVGAISSVLPFAAGGVVSGGAVVPFADGGVVSGPMMFPMSGGQTGLMGEAGPEAIMPLKRGRDGKLGVVAQNTSLNVTITMDKSTGALGAFVTDQAGKVVARAAPQIVDTAVGSVIEANMRGGAKRRGLS